MLPKSRILSALLVGLGLALVVAGLAAPLILNGDARLPLDVRNMTWTVEDPAGTVGPERTGVTHQLHMTVQNPSDGETAGVRIGETVMRSDRGSDFENLVTAATWAGEMDRHTGEFSGPLRLNSVMVLPEIEVAQTGPWLKFPSDVEKTDYDVFEPTLRTTVPARFIGEDAVAGRTVYKFEQVASDVNVAEQYADEQNTTMLAGPEDEQITAFKHHCATRVFTVDQITGLVVGISESVDDYYADEVGGRVEDILSYDGEMDAAQTEALAAQLPSVTQSLSQTVTYAVIGAGLLLLVGGLIGALRPGRRGHRAAHAAPVQEGY